MIAAKAFDPVVGVDIHIIQPPGPVPPVPVPHPFIGMLVDPMDFAPIIGATVLVNGMPRATAGTGGKCIPPHIPIGGVFVKPPANECEIFMGSSTVLADGDPLSFLGMPCLSCHDVGMPPPPRLKKKRKPKSLTLPTSVVLAVPAGAPVLVGGPPTVSMMALGMKAAMAGLGKAFKKLRKLQKGSKKMKALSDRAQAAAKKAMDRLGVPPNVQNRVHRSICSVTGHPVDVATGKVFTEHVDLELPGPIGLKWERVWYSTSVYNGPLGHGWHHSYDIALLGSEDGSSIAVRLPDGRPLAFPALAEGQSYFDRVERLRLSRYPGGYELLDSRGLKYRLLPGSRTDPVHRLSSMENPGGDRLEFSYDATGRLVGIIDSAGRHVTLQSDRLGRITSMNVPHPDNPGQTIAAAAFEYDHHGDLCEVRDALGQRSRYRYDDHLLVCETNRNGYSYYFSYDGTGPSARCVHTHGDGGRFERSLAYDDAGQTLVKDSLGHVTYYQSDSSGRVIRRVDPRGGETRTVFGDANEKLSETDALGHTTAFTYDEHGNCTGIIQPDGSVLEWAYDINDHLVSFTNGAGSTWQLAYDNAGRLTQKIDPLGHVTTYLYDGYRPSEIIDAAGRHTRIDYYETGLVASLTFADGSMRRWAYDSLGRQVQTIDQRGRVRRRQLDLLGRVIAIEEPDGSTRRYEYDGEGNLTRVADEHDIRFAYTPTGRVAGRMQGDVHVDFRYDSEDRLVGVRNELGDEYRLELDANGRIIAEIGFDGSRRLYTRDVVGRVLKLVRASGSVTEYEHDELGRILRASHSDGTTEKYRYGGAGALLAVTNSTGTLELERDPVGRVIVERQGRHWVESRLDALGTRVHMTSSLGARQTVSRTQMGNVDRVRYSHSDEAVGVEGEIAFAYDALGLEMERRLPGSVISRIERDALGRPTRLQVQRDRTTMIDHRYEWDASAQLRRLLDGDTGATTYQHDALGQLAAAHYDDGEVELRLPDVVGNLFRSRDRKDSVYGPGGQVLSVTGRNGTTYYQYDADGRLSKKQGAEGSWTYRWNVTGLLSEVSRPDGSTVSFEYDGLGRRIRKRVGQRETRWVWDGNNPLHEWTSANTATPEPAHADLITWIFQPETVAPLAKLAGGRSFGIVTDYSGAPKALFDEEGRRVWSARLGIYGELRNVAGERGAVPFRFAGQYEDAETGLYYNRFRYYDPAVGGYLSPDPILLLGGHRLYAYGPDPLTATDPLGLSSAGCTPGDSVSLYHGSINDATHIRKNGLDPDRTPTWVSRDRAAAENAISDQRYDVACGDARDPGIVESRIPREEYDRVFAPSERDYSGFGGGMDSSEVVLRNEEQVETFNKYIVQEGG